MHDGTPIVDGGLQLGEMSRSHQREPSAENDLGLCGTSAATGGGVIKCPLPDRHVVKGQSQP